MSSLFGFVVYSSPNGPVWSLVLLLHHWRAPVSHLFSFRSSCPICFPWASFALNFAFPWAFIEFFGFSQPNHIILYPWGSWACYQPLTFFTFITLGLFSLFHIIYCPWFALFFFSLSFHAPLSSFIPLRPICLSHGLVIHYFCRLGLMGFLSIYQLFSICVVGLLLFTWTSKMAINNFFFFFCHYTFTVFLIPCSLSYFLDQFIDHYYYNNTNTNMFL